MESAPPFLLSTLSRCVDGRLAGKPLMGIFVSTCLMPRPADQKTGRPAIAISRGENHLCHSASQLRLSLTQSTPINTRIKATELTTYSSATVCYFHFGFDLLLICSSTVGQKDSVAVSTSKTVLL